MASLVRWRKTRCPVSQHLHQAGEEENAESSYCKRPHVTSQSQGTYVRAIASLCSYPLGLKSDGVATGGRMLISEMN